MELPLPDRESLKSCLEAAQAPLWESELFRSAWPAEHQADWTALELFRRHFQLFAALYDMADQYLAQGFYLHVHFMRTRLLPLPPSGRCGHYEAEAGAFCGLPAPCAFHPASRLPEPADSRGFYRDPAHIDWMDEDDAQKVMAGAWQLLSNWPKAEAAWQTLGLQPGSPPQLVRRRYRELARRHHPDSRSAHQDEIRPEQADFRVIHEAYRLLCELFPLRMH